MNIIMDMVETRFGTLLKRYRRAARLSQQALAGRAQLSARGISDLERGVRRAPRKDTVRQLIAALGLEPAQHAEFEAAARRQRRAPSSDAAAAGTARTGGPFAPAPSPLWAQPTPLLGREGDLEAIRQRLLDEHVRLLTVTGPAGVGKTRLALEAGAQIADRFPDGATLVDLSPVRDSVLVLPAMAQALGLADTGRRPLPERLAEYLRERTLLLILDNFEQVLPAASRLAELLATCPGVALLVTSRMPLQLRWEQTLHLRPLAVPDLAALPSRDRLATVPAIALFLARVRRINPAFVLADDNLRAVAELCVRLDGLPLALELAAARTRLLSPRMVLERMSGQSVASLREQVEQEGRAAAYREGRSLSFGAVATVTLAVLDDFAQTLAHPKTKEEHRPNGSLLSKRELEVLRLVAEGFTSKAIGRRLFISPSTVNYHLSSIFSKLGVASRAQAVVVAARHGLT